MMCQRITDKTNDEVTLCGDSGRHTVELYDRLLNIRGEYMVCDKHLAEFEQAAAKARTKRGSVTQTKPRPARTTDTFSN